MDVKRFPFGDGRTRRDMFRKLVTFSGGSPLLAQETQTDAQPRTGGSSITYPHLYAGDVMKPTNVIEFEPIAKTKIHNFAY
jgi:hypothetical protein